MKLENLIETEERINREDLLYKTGNTKKDRVHEFQKYKTMQFLGIAMSKGLYIKYVGGGA